MAEQPTLQEAFDAALAEISPKQQKLVHAFLVDLHQKNAAIRAGYTPEHASTILRNLKIRAAIAAGMALHAMPVPELLHRIADHARGDMSDFLTIAEEEVVIDQHVNGVLTTTETVRRPVARLDLDKAAAAGKLHLLKTYSLTDKGLRAELYDAHAAQALLARIHGLLVDRTEVTGKGGDPIAVRFTTALDKAYAADDPDNQEPGTD